MNAVERSALTAAFLAAVVVAGLALAYVPHVELVTLVVFSSGILLGSLGGAGVGAIGMPLYVFANTAVRGFPPSPLPLLAAQALGMMFPGLAGGAWRRIWLRGGAARRLSLLTLPIVGIGLSALYQTITNFSFAYFLSDGSSPRLAVFASGMAFGLLDMASNGVVFAVAGPGTASLLRRVARDRGWWRGVRGSVIVFFAAAICSGSALARTAAEPEPGSPAQPVAFEDSLLQGAAGDTIVAAPAESLAASPDSLRRRSPVPRASGPRRLDFDPAPLWIASVAEAPARTGAPSFLSAGLLAAGEVSRGASPGTPGSLDRWGLGWGRTRFTYEGLPFGGAVNRFEEPVALPLAWHGGWSEEWTASGTAIDVGAPPPPAGAPTSQVSLTTGSFGRRTAEFALFRSLGGWEIGADLGDREEQGIYDVTEIDANRFWFHLRPARGRRPDWSVDLGTGSESRKLTEGGELGRQARRLFATLRGPFAGGDTRLGVALRRDALQDRGTAAGFGEVLFDGYTLQADWAGPFARGLLTRVRWDLDRERDDLQERSFHGVWGTLRWSGRGGPARIGAEGTVGNQDPYGMTWEGLLVAQVGDERRGGKLALAHEEDLPAMVIGIDRPTPEAGLFDRLDAYADAEDPEKRTSLRLEGTWADGPVSVRAGGWGAKVRHYRVDANPVWERFSEFSPLPYPPDWANILGAYGRVHLDLSHRFFAEGGGRVHDRDLLEVPYTSRWRLEGAIHWRRSWFKNSVDLDAGLGGTVVGPRRSPDGVEYPATALSALRLVGKVDNGTVTVALENLLDSYLESDLRASDTVTPFPVPGRTLVVGLTLVLSQ